MVLVRSVQFLRFWWGHLVSQRAFYSSNVVLVGSFGRPCTLSWVPILFWWGRNAVLGGSSPFGGVKFHLIHGGRHGELVNPTPISLRGPADSQNPTGPQAEVRNGYPKKLM